MPLRDLESKSDIKLTRRLLKIHTRYVRHQHQLDVLILHDLRHSTYSIKKRKKREVKLNNLSNQFYEIWEKLQDKPRFRFENPEIVVRESFHGFNLF